MPSETRASSQSVVPRGCKPSLAVSVVPVRGPCASVVNKSSSTALSSALDPQKARPSCMIASGTGCLFVMIFSSSGRSGHRGCEEVQPLTLPVCCSRVAESALRSLTVVAETSAGAKKGEQQQARREDDACADPRAAVGGRADRPGPRGLPPFEQRVLAEHHVAHRGYPREQATGDQRAQQSQAGDPDDIPGEYEDAVVEALAGRAQLQGEDREPGQRDSSEQSQVGQPPAAGPFGLAKRAVRR